MDISRRQLQEKVEQASSVSGSGTELVTVWIPSDKNLDTVRSRLRGEVSDAENIKSKQTREHVQGALERVLNVLHKQRTVPESGVVICAGYNPQTNEYVTFVFDKLPQPISESKYSCSDSFDIDGLASIVFGDDEWWGLVTVTRDAASVGRYTRTSTDYIDVIDTFESQVMGKSKAGGQSQKRFERVRIKQREDHYKKVADIVTSSFEGENFQGFALGGPKVTVADFAEWLPERLTEQIIARKRVDHAGSKESLKSLAKRAESSFEQVEQRREREYVDSFKRRLKEDGAVAYGPDEVDTALSYGAVDTLLISADLSSTYIEKRSDKVTNQGGDVEIISTLHDEGRQLDTVFGGEAALCRFKIH